MSKALTKILQRAANAHAYVDNDPTELEIADAFEKARGEEEASAAYEQARRDAEEDESGWNRMAKALIDTQP